MEVMKPLPVVDNNTVLTFIALQVYNIQGSHHIRRLYPFYITEILYGIQTSVGLLLNKINKKNLFI